MNQPRPEIHVAAQIITDLSPTELVALLRQEGVDAHLKESAYSSASIRLKGRGDIDGFLQSADPGEYLLRDGLGERHAMEALSRGLSAALLRLGIRHRVELYDEHDRMFDYLHHDWPLDAV